METLKELLAEKKSVFGAFAKTSDPMFIEAMGVNYIACSVDVGIFARACAEMADAFGGSD